jgi:hypothetical protein
MKPRPILIALALSCAAAIVSAQPPLQQFLQMSLRAVNGALLVTSAAPGAQGPLQNVANMRLRAANGALYVTGTEGMLFAPQFNISNVADTNYKCVALGTIPANTIGAVGDEIAIEMDFLNASGTSTRTFAMNVAGTCAADGTGFTGGFTFYSATNAVSVQQTFHSVRLQCTASCTTTAAAMNGSGGYYATNASTTQGSAQTTGTANTTVALALGLAFKDSASAVNTLFGVTVFWKPAPR